jgi:hypothetical protein
MTPIASHHSVVWSRRDKQGEGFEGAVAHPVEEAQKGTQWAGREYSGRILLLKVSQDSGAFRGITQTWQTSAL